MAIRNYNFQTPDRKRKFTERRRVNNKQTEAIIIQWEETSLGQIFDRLEKRFIKIYKTTIVHDSFAVIIFRHLHVILHRLKFPLWYGSQLNIFAGNKKSNVVSWK